MQSNRKGYKSLRWDTKSISRFFIIFIFVLALALIMSVNTENDKSSAVAGSINLLSSQSWANVAGTSLTAAGVHIIPLGRAIVNQDGSGGQPNPPVNLSGPHLKVSGDFTISTTMDGITTNSATLQLYGKPPIIYDEWRQETPSLRIRVTSNNLQIAIWNGFEPNPAQLLSYITATQPSIIKITVTHSSHALTIRENNLPAKTISDSNIFSSGNVWFGVDASLGSSGWTMTQLVARQNGAGSLSVVNAPAITGNHSNPDALRNLSSASSRKLPIGVAISLTPLMTNSLYRALAISQFNMWTTENDLKPQFVHPQPSVYSFKDADMLVNTALANGIKVHGHTLVFGEANPHWMQNTPLANRKQVMINHINTVVGHYKGKISEWDVVNEPVADYDQWTPDTPLRNTIWYQAMGESYIDTAFKTAHAADPTAKLYLNDYGLEADDERWAYFLNFVKTLKQRGVPIDGVGFEGHVYNNSDHINPYTLRDHIQKLAALGLGSRVSEIDVHGDNASVQANEYKNVLWACMNEPTCTAFGTWGISDRYGSTTEIRSYPLQLGDDLLWDELFQPKPAFYAVKSEL